MGKEPGFEVKGSASLLADDITEDIVHLTLSVCGLKEQQAVVPSPNESERFDGKHYRNPIEQGAISRICNRAKRKKAKTIYTERRERLCIYLDLMNSSL